MRSVCRISTHCLATLSFVALCLTTVTAQQAQTRDVRVISVRAGGVNFVSGDVTFKAEQKGGWQRLAATHNLDSGFRVKTGADGLAEVLLNPGSYLRLGGGSELELTDASLDSLSMRLDRGSVVIEAATGYGDASDFGIAVVTPQTRVAIIRSGVYRINVLPTGLTEVAVFKGRALVGGGEDNLVKGGKVATVGAGGRFVAKLDKQNRDALDDWSKERAALLVKANDKLRGREVRTMLAGYNPYDASYRGAGVWVYSSRTLCYTFVPFEYGFASPYGRWYGTFLNWGGFCGNCGYAYGGGRPYYGGAPSSAPSSGANPSPAPQYRPNPSPIERPAPAERPNQGFRDLPNMPAPPRAGGDNHRPVRRDQ